MKGNPLTEHPDDEPARRRTIRRMAPEERKRELVEKAAEFFSEEGFEAGTRVLAGQLGISQPLIYRYFASKDDLIDEVYYRVYIDQWQDSWLERLRDRDVPLRERLADFYASYTATIFNRRWMRIFYFAALKGLDINNRYMERVRHTLLVPIGEEMRAETGHMDTSSISETELEAVWLMHGMIFYQGIREHIYRSASTIDYDFVIKTAIDMYMDKAPAVIASSMADGAPGAAPGSQGPDA